MSLVDSLRNERICTNLVLSEILVDNISNVTRLELLIWDDIIRCEINRIDNIHISCNPCISIVECILIDTSVAAVVEISTCWETCVHHTAHVIGKIVWVIIHDIHAIHIVEIHVVLILVEVIHGILVLILVVLISLISLFRIIVGVIATSRITRIAIRISVLT